MLLQLKRKGSIAADVNVYSMNISKIRAHLKEKSGLQTEACDVKNQCSESTNNRAHGELRVNGISQVNTLHTRSYLSDNKTNQCSTVNTCNVPLTLRHVLEEFFKTRPLRDSKLQSETFFDHLEKEWITTLEAFISLTPQQCRLLNIPLGLPNAVCEYAVAQKYLGKKQLPEDLTQPLSVNHWRSASSVQDTHFLLNNVSGAMFLSSLI
ncbi:uncharacterized protein LOC128883729 [Hylaeus volcanicus]|uniref:uncharacterized protein LOC128883729 n=1 Tax=Hylaeus volcanicus TaxID=313075 RepID=UPI0023B88214|nr:uncharacterized protein LOC128883729 [Hylaeus volcanicus]